MRTSVAALLLLCGLTFFSSCREEKKREFSFYHWKTRAKYSPVVKAALQSTATETIYLHYFDIDLRKEKKEEKDGIYPVAVLKEVDEEFRQYNRVPVIFITNRVLKEGLDLEGLSSRMYELVKQISLHHFNEMPESIQLDCDWTESTREKYFKLIELQQQHYEVSATIRLHQIKYKDRTGIPPVKKGMLMVYNVGKLDDDKQNSILEPSIVKEYVNSETQYPLELDVALPLYSQVVVKNNSNEIRLLNGVDRKSLDSNPTLFRQLGKNNFEVVADTLYKGLYLFKGYKLKVEEVSVDEVLESYKIVKSSKLIRGKVVFYHLDDLVLTNINIESIWNQL